MSKSPPSGYPLPTVINPGSFRYVCVPIPDDPGHRQAFSGAIYSLTRWFSWQGDPDKRGILAAQVWTPIFFEVMQQMDEDLAGCGLQGVRQNPDNSCELQYSPDGVTWVTFANIELCDHDHLEYVAINPNSITRNVVTPTGNYPSLVLNAITGQTEDIFRVVSLAGNIALPAGGGLTSTGRQQWRNGGSQFLDFNALVGTTGFGRLFPHQNYRNISIGTTNSDQRVLVGDNVGTATARFHIKNFLATLPTLDLQSAASQTAYVLRILNNSGTLISGFDEVGRLANVTGSGKPTDLIVRAGVQRVDASAKKIWVKGANSGTDDWWAVEPLPTSGIIDTVDIEMIPAGDPPSGSVTGSTLHLEIPETTIPATPNYWFKKREDRPSPGESASYDLVCLADGFTMLPIAIEDGDSIGIDFLDGWWCDVLFDATGSAARPTGYNANGSLFTDPLTFTYDAGDPEPTDPHMCLLVEWQREDGSYARERLFQFAVVNFDDVNSLNPYARFYANKPSFSDAAGGVQFRVQFSATTLVEIVATIGSTDETIIDVNDEFTITMAAESGSYYNYNAAITFSQCVVVEVVSSSGLTPGGSGSNMNFGYGFCSGGLAFNKTYTIPADTEINSLGFNSTTPGSMTFRLLAVV